MAVPFPHVSFLLSFVVLVYFSEAAWKERGGGMLCGCQGGSFEDHGAHAELGMEAQPFSQNTLPLM